MTSSIARLLATQATRKERGRAVAQLLIGNWGTEAEMADMTPEMLRHAGSQGQRMLWDARPGDVVVLPFEPDPDFLRYVTALLGFDAASLRIVVPPADKGGAALTRDRLEDEAFVAHLRGLVEE